MKKEIIEKLLNYEKELMGKINKFQDIAANYLKEMDELEKLKIEVIDPTKRDSVEKQLMAGMQNNEKLREVFLNTERLRREKDLIYREIDAIKTFISINQSILNVIGG